MCVFVCMIYYYINIQTVFQCQSIYISLSLYQIQLTGIQRQQLNTVCLLRRKALISKVKNCTETKVALRD